MDALPAGLAPTPSIAPHATDKAPSQGEPFVGKIAVSALILAVIAVSIWIIITANVE
jgi:hypothetical protein